MHGHASVPWGESEALAQVARELNADVVVSGHTHVASVVEADGRCYVNPGSITGAFAPRTPKVAPSFILMSVSKGAIDFFLYTLQENGELKITQSAFRKPVVV